MRLLRRRGTQRVMVIGLDCAEPSLVFDQFRDDLPTLNRLMSAGTWGKLASSTPCITIPAWSSMLTSRDPGELGFYGFRNRVNYDYGKMAVVNGASVKFPRLWDYLSDAGKTCFVANVPQTYPLRPINGHMISGFLTPGVESAFTYPAVYKREVLNTVPDYDFDVKDFRTPDKAQLAQRLFDLAEKQFKVLTQGVNTSWDFFMHVNMGVDRVHHGFWQYHDHNHRNYDPNSPFKDTIRNYYKLVDEQIRRLIETAGDVTVLVVSDHGAKRMDGGICLNEWLWQNGWLVLKSSPPDGQLTRFDDLDVDWSRTKAWGAGGYYARVFLNVEGREPQGVIPQTAYDETRDALAAALQAISVPGEPPLNTRIIKPQDVYATVNNIAPDLMVYFGDLHWRSVGTVGHGKHYTFENDTGPDDANHAEQGMFILYEPGKGGFGQVADGYQLMDVTPTVLDRMQIDIPQSLRGKVIR